MPQDFFAFDMAGFFRKQPKGATPMSYIHIGKDIRAFHSAGPCRHSTPGRGAWLRTTARNAAADRCRPVTARRTGLSRNRIPPRLRRLRAAILGAPAQRPEPERRGEALRSQAAGNRLPPKTGKGADVPGNGAVPCQMPAALRKGRPELPGAAQGRGLYPPRGHPQQRARMCIGIFVTLLRADISKPSRRQWPCTLRSAGKSGVKARFTELQLQY